MPKVEHRSVTPLLSKFRNFLRGRTIVGSLRHADEISSRTQPPATVPGGPYHKTSKVYYYPRDARRMVQPPIVVVEQRSLPAGEKQPAEHKSTTPNKVYPPMK